jgi:glycosyltransferase involved in cell wall biosynthesis
MRIAFIARSTLYEVHGGITVQVLETAKQLRETGVEVTVCLADEEINYDEFDLLHFFDITRPANILYHIGRTQKPFVLSPVLIDYSEYDKNYRRGLSGFVFRRFKAGTNEYIKAVSRWLLSKDKLQSKHYLWKGHDRSIRRILRDVSMVLPNSGQEYEQLTKSYSLNKPYRIIPNGIDKKIFTPGQATQKNEKLVICAARIEGIKNQLNLIRALNDTCYRLLLIGDASPNQRAYYDLCRQTAGANISFIGRIPQEELTRYYREAKVHVLPSWFETCGLSSLEAGAMGCNVVVADKGFTREYFGENAFYCDPGNVESIYNAVHEAATSPSQEALQASVLKNYTWQQAARQTLEAYQSVLAGACQKNLTLKAAGND